MSHASFHRSNLLNFNHDVKELSLALHIFDVCLVSVSINTTKDLLCAQGAQRPIRGILSSTKDLHIKFQVKIIKKNHEKTWILFIKPLIKVNLSKDWFVTTYCWTVMKKMGIDTDPNIIRILLCFIFYRNFLLGFFINRICDV